MSFPKYPAYKDSGENWLGEVPDQWRISSLKRNFVIVGGSTPSSDDTNWNGDICWVTPADLSGLEGLYIHSSKRTITESGVLSCSTKLLPKLSLILSTRAPIGSLGIASREMCTNQGCKGLIPNTSTSSHFFAYLLQSAQTELNTHGSGATFLEISGDQLGRFNVPTPSFAEQIKISRFLDHETVKIDTLIEEQKRLIELLKEKRQAVISHAVTKGLDPNVPMKDSRVEWLGDVPAHWGIVPLKHLSTLNPRKSAYTGDHSQLCSFVPMEKLKTGLMILDEDQVISDVFDGYTYFEDLDVLQAKVTPCFENKNMAVARNLTNGVGFGSSEINVLRPSKNISSQFLYYRLQEDGYMDVCTASMTGAGGLKRVPSEIIENFRIALPNIHEQESIVQHLDAIVLQTDSLVAYAENGIELLHERRSALISAAVTGKIDVRGWQPPASSVSTQQENMMETT